jgi:hypothetical protein
VPFWRREPVHRRLAREGGLEPPPHRPGPHWGEVGIHGLARPREWDATAVVEAGGLRPEELEFVALPDGTLLVEDEVPDDALGPLADAIEASLAPPYRARAVRRGGDVWAVGARRIEVAELDEAGDELERLEGDVFVRARRLDGPLWEVERTPL